LLVKITIILISLRAIKLSMNCVYNRRVPAEYIVGRLPAAGLTVQSDSRLL